MAFETTSDGFALSDAPERFDLASGHAWIAGESYWAAGIPLATFEAAVRGSLTVGVYAPSGEMAAMARVVTDRATFAWICDVLVRESHRGQGLGEAIMAYLERVELTRNHIRPVTPDGLQGRSGAGPDGS